MKKKEDMIWEFKSSNDHREYIINILEMYDSFKNKSVQKEIVINNKEELKIDFDI